MEFFVSVVIEEKILKAEEGQNCFTKNTPCGGMKLNM